MSSTARDKLKHLTIKDHQYGLNGTFFFFTFLFCVCVCVCACGWVFYYIFLLAFWSFPFTCAICSTVLSSLFDLFSFEKGRAILIHLLKLGLFLNLFINYRPQRQLRECNVFTGVRLSTGGGVSSWCQVPSGGGYAWSQVPYMGWVCPGDGYTRGWGWVYQRADILEDRGGPLQHVRLASGWYASYWNAFLLTLVVLYQSKGLLCFLNIFHLAILF